MENSKIEWCENTFNPWIGCTKVSPACDNCYAESLMDNRLHVANWGPGQPRVRTSAKNWNDPVRWNKAAEAAGTRPFVFCASLADVFDNEVDPGWRADLFQLIENTPQLVWLLLTKRVGNVPKMAPNGLPENAALGATICNQEEADRDIYKLLQVPALFRFLSCEPLLGPLNLWNCKIPGSDHRTIQAFNGLDSKGVYHGPADDTRGIDWVIVGGESGPNARPMHPVWATDLLAQCEDAGCAFLFKQWGEWLPFLSRGDTITFTNSKGVWSGDDLHRFPDGQELARVGKKNAGNMLLGKTRLDRPCV